MNVPGVTMRSFRRPATHGGPARKFQDLDAPTAVRRTPRGQKLMAKIPQQKQTLEELRLALKDAYEKMQIAERVQQEAFDENNQAVARYAAIRRAYISKSLSE